jgi:hypothetical protein
MAVVASAVAVFVGSSILHMVLQYHKADYKKLADEDPLRDALRKAAPGPGLYFTPYCADHKQMKDPAMQEKFRQGPVAMITVAPSGNISMGRNLGLWFLFSVLVSFVAAYVARHTLHPGADGITVMRVTATVAFAAYGLGNVSDSIWKAAPWSNTFRSLVDALVYSIITGFIFKLLWPAA